MRLDSLHTLAIALPLFVATSPLEARQGDPGAWSDAYDQPGLLGRAYTVTTYGGELIAGGPGAQADGHFFGFTARFDGSRWRPMGKDIFSKSGNPHVRHHVGVYTEYQGDLIAGGHFTGAAGKPVYSVARWDGADWHGLGAGVLGIVRAAAVYQGDLYVAGEFETAGGGAVKNIARWDGVAWHDVGGGLTKSFEPEVHDLLVGPDGKLYASGEFDTAGGKTVKNVAAWDGATWSALGGGLPGSLNSRVFALAWYQDRLWAGGNFDLVAGGTDDEKVASFDGTSWQAEGSFPDGVIVGTSVNELTVHGDDLFACGNLVEVDGIPVIRLARFDGTAWGAVGGVSGSDVETDIWGATVYGGKLVVAGEFSRAGYAFGYGEPVITHSVAAFDGIDWEGVGGGLGFNAGVTRAIRWNGGVVAVGGFNEAGSEYTGGADLISGPVFHDGTTWTPLGDFKGHPKALLEWNGDLIVAGDFTQIDGQSIQSVARFDGTQWTGFGGGAGDRSALAVYQGQLYAGGLGGVLRWNGTSWESFAEQLFGQISVMHVHQGVLYIGGSMYDFGNLVAWDGTTQEQVGGGTSGTVAAFGSYGNDLLVGGWFGLEIWDGNAFSPFPGVTGPLVSALTYFQGELHASGVLLGGANTPPGKYIARWDDGAWKPLGGGIDGQATTLVADDAGGHLYAGGAIAQADGLPSRWFARWDTDGGGLGTVYCSPAQPNSTGAPAALSASGSPVAADNDVNFAVTSLPAQQFGYFLVSESQASIPVGDGILCLGAPQKRFSKYVLNSGPLGEVNFSPDLVSGLPAGVTIDPGDTWHFTLWFRDGPSSNFSDAVSILFE